MAVYRSLVNWNPWFVRQIPLFVDFLDLLSGSFDSSSALKFNVFLYDSGFAIKQRNWLSDSESWWVIQESLNKPAIITDSASQHVSVSSLDEFLSQNLN